MDKKVVRLCSDCYHDMDEEYIPRCRECLTVFHKPYWEERKLSTRKQAINLVDVERDRQDIKWGEQNHTQQGWTGILGEEYGEYCQAVNETYLNNATKKHEGGYDNMMKELTHVAAVAVGAMECLMRARERGEI